MLCIAVLHHISTVERRLAMLAELARVLQLGGRALVTVWASEQEQPGKLAKWEPIGPGESMQPGLMLIKFALSAPCSLPIHLILYNCSAKGILCGGQARHCCFRIEPVVPASYYLQLYELLLCTTRCGC